MTEILDRSGKAFRKPKPDQNKRHQILMNEAMLNLVARVQNMEAVIVMLATTVQSTAYNPDVKTEVDVYMEAWFQAQVKRGAVHLEREIGKDSEVFI